MREELHEYLDGDRSKDDLPPELREQAVEWDRRLEAYRERSEESAPAWIRPKVLREIDERENQSGAGIWDRWAWLPLAAAAALVVALWMKPWQASAPDGPTRDRPVAEASAEEAVTRFRLEAPDAERVAVAGSFTDWRPTVQLSDEDGDGVWTGSVPLEAGVHQYMFVLDGEQWVTDPDADRYVADGFGHRNAVVAVTP